MEPSGAEEERPGESRGSAGPGGSRDSRRLLVGVLFMAALLGITLVAAFFMGQPAPGADVAPGVPVLAGSGAALIAGAAAVFYGTYRGQ